MCTYPREYLKSIKKIQLAASTRLMAITRIIKISGISGSEILKKTRIRG